MTDYDSNSDVSKQSDNPNYWDPLGNKVDKQNSTGEYGSSKNNDGGRE